MRLSALDCLRRGWTNLSANWELVLLQWLEGALLAALLALGLFLPLLIVGANLLGKGGAAPQAEAADRPRAGLSPAPLAGLIAMPAGSLPSPPPPHSLPARPPALLPAR